MGIPGYFSRYATKFPNTIIKHKLELIDALFLDFNCAIHPCCRKFAREQYSHTRKEICEKYMIDECLAYLIKIIKYAGPRRLVYIAIDGVAPRAKMVQQRNRRFKSIKEREMDAEIKKRTGYHDPNISKELQEFEDEFWDTNSISPGTVFMAKLTDALKRFFKENNDPFFETLTVIISDSNQPGEGEHKILSYLREHQNEIQPNHNVVIYGLDADLIMLAMVSHINRIYLLRESNEFGKEYHDSSTTFCYLDIDLFKFSIMQELSSKIMHKMEVPDQLLLVDDYVFLCFMIGNDFLPNLPSLHIKDSGLDLLTTIYTDIFTFRTHVIKKYEWVRDSTIYTGDVAGAELEGGWRSDRSNYTLINKYQYLVDTHKGTINQEFLQEILEKLSNVENNMMRKLEEKRNTLRPYNKNTNNQYEVEKNKLENYPILHRNEEKYIDINNQDNNWPIRYYKQCFHFEANAQNVNDVCYKYIQGLLWTLNYYYKGCQSWGWYYPYHHAPIINDIYKFVIDTEKWKSVRLYKSLPLRPFEQLMFILPPESKHLLPESYQSLMTSNSPIAHYYPETYKFDTIFRRFFWQCPPILPPINAQCLKKSLQKKPLTKDEQLRDMVMDPEIIKGSKISLL
jgi:5'-3' exonuclease